jgi:hypothetical protein
MSYADVQTDGRGALKMLTLYGYRNGSWLWLGGSYIDDRVGHQQLKRDSEAVRDMGFTKFEARAA